MEKTFSRLKSRLLTLKHLNNRNNDLNRTLNYLQFVVSSALIIIRKKSNEKWNWHWTNQAELFMASVVLNTKHKVKKRKRTLKVLLNLLHQLLQAGGMILNNHNSHISYSPWISALLCPAGPLNETWGFGSPCGGNTQWSDQRTLWAQVPSCDTAGIIGWLRRSRYLCQFSDSCGADGWLYDSDTAEISGRRRSAMKKGRTK